MRLAIGVTCFTLLTSSCPAYALSAAPIVARQLEIRPLAFTENCGQWNSQVLFQARTRGMVIWFTSEGVTCQPIHRANPESPTPGDLNPIPPILPITPIRAIFANANPTPTITGEGPLKYQCNYFLGNDPAKWHTRVPNYDRIVYHDLYPGIDLAFYGKDGRIEYDFIVQPGADPSEIALQYNGSLSTSVDHEGNLVLATPGGELIHHQPLVYEVLPNGERLPTGGRFCASEDGSVHFDLQERSSPSLALVIDPVLTYSTYLGGNDVEQGFGIAVDNNGQAHVIGYTASVDFPTVGAIQTDSTGNDVFVTKFDSTGSAPVYSTYLGGNGDDVGRGIALDNNRNAYITGSTSSTDFPVNNPFQGTHAGNGDGFVAKLTEAGNGLLYCTYLGGANGDDSRAIGLDGLGNVYVAGVTYSVDFPTLNPYQKAQGSADGFVTKLADTGDKLHYSTYLGGTDYDRIMGIAVDGAGYAYVTGNTSSSDFPTVEPYQIKQGGGDAFVTKLNLSGDRLVYSTYLGGTAADYGNCIALSEKGIATVAGETYSGDFPTVGAIQPAKDVLEDCFVTKLSKYGNTLVYSTFLGGNGYDRAHAIASDPSGNAYITGQTGSTTFPTVNPIQTDQPGYDAFVTKLNPKGDALEYSTYLGGSDLEDAYGIAIDGSGNAYVTGTTFSTDFPLVGPYEGDRTSSDAFVSKIGPGVTDVFEPQSPILPTTSALWQNVPNPFNASTIIRFTLRSGGDVSLAIYNVLGQRVRAHDERGLNPGSYSYEWDGRDDAGRELPSGVYLYRLTTAQFTDARKMTLLK